MVDGWVDNTRYRVRGGAGSGKTVLAVETAKRLAEQGKRVLLLCYNRHLADHLARDVGAWEAGPGTIEARNFHSLCARAHFEVHGRRMDVPETSDARTAFWNDEAPLFLLEAIESGKMQPWDAIVVDEGQDFSSGWWTVLQDALCDAERGHLLVFYDPSQNIFERDDSVPDSPSFRLTTNFRNTKRIAEVVRSLGDSKMRPSPRCPEGAPPSIHEQLSPAKMRHVLSQLMSKFTEQDGLAPEQITILTPHTRPKSSLADMETLGRLHLTHDPADRRGKVLHTTIGKFKGLESDVVVLADIDPRDHRCSRRARYVAASRARHLLYVYAKGDWLS